MRPTVSSVQLGFDVDHPMMDGSGDAEEEFCDFWLDLPREATGEQFLGLVRQWIVDRARQEFKRPSMSQSDALQHPVRVLVCGRDAQDLLASYRRRFGE